MFRPVPVRRDVPARAARIGQSQPRIAFTADPSPKCHVDDSTLEQKRGPKPTGCWSATATRSESGPSLPCLMYRECGAEVKQFAGGIASSGRSRPGGAPRDGRRGGRPFGVLRLVGAFSFNARLDRQRAFSEGYALCERKRGQVLALHISEPVKVLTKSSCGGPGRSLTFC